MRFRASSAFRRNAADDGSANARRVAILLLPLRRPDFGRSPLALDRSLRGLQFRTGAAEELLRRIDENEVGVLFGPKGEVASARIKPKRCRAFDNFTAIFQRE